MGSGAVVKYVGRLCATTGCSVILRDRGSVYCLACTLDRMPEPVEVETLHCEWCDESMYGAHRRWCSDTCRVAAHQQRTTWSRALERYWDQAS